MNFHIPSPETLLAGLDWLVWFYKPAIELMGRTYSAQDFYLSCVLMYLVGILVAKRGLI